MTKDDRFHISATIVPPPDLVKQGAKAESLTKTVAREAIEGSLAEVIAEATFQSLLDQGASLVFLIQPFQRQGGITIKLQEARHQ